MCMPSFTWNADLKRFHGSLYMQVKLISSHQAEIQFVKNMLVKIMGSGEDYSGCSVFGRLLTPLIMLSG